MNKESIYIIIGYHGEYDANVKKAIRKLLKENHPDNKGDRKIFELITEVKNELENNNVSYIPKNSNKSTNKNDDIDYDYCLKMINKIVKEKNIYTNILMKKKEKLAKNMNDYKKYYHDSIDLESYLLSNSQYMNKLMQNKKVSVFLLIIAIIFFVISIINKSIVLFIIFVLFAIICVLITHESFVVMQKIADNNRMKVNSYVGVNNKLRNNKTNQDKLKKEITELNHKINDLDNDIRFYNNIINNR